MTFEPNKVPSESWRSWFKEAIELSTRKVLYFVILAFAFVYIEYSVPFGILNNTASHFISTLFFSLAILLAYCADTGKSFFKELRNKPKIVWVRLLISALISATLFAFFYSLEHFFRVSDTVTTLPFFEPTIFTPFTHTSGNTFVWLFFLGVANWSLIPLVLLGELPLREAFSQSVTSTTELNKFVVWVYALLAVFIIVVGMILTPLIIIPWFAITTSMMYVSYRHIWLDKGLNEPKKVKASNPMVVSST